MRLPRSLFPRADDALAAGSRHRRAESAPPFTPCVNAGLVRFCGEACRPSAGSDSLVRLERPRRGGLRPGSKSTGYGPEAPGFWAQDPRSTTGRPISTHSGHSTSSYAHSPPQECPLRRRYLWAAVPWLPDAAPARTDDGRLNLLPGDTCESSSWPASTDSVGASFSRGYGLFDVTGNVSEWTSDWFSPHPDEVESPCCAPRNPRATSPEVSPGETIPRRVIKGGSHLCAPNYCLRYRPAARQGQPFESSTSTRLPLHPAFHFPLSAGTWHRSADQLLTRPERRSGMPLLRNRRGSSGTQYQMREKMRTRPDVTDGTEIPRAGCVLVHSAS